MGLDRERAQISKNCYNSIDSLETSKRKFTLLKISCDFFKDLVSGLFLYRQRITIVINRPCVAGAVLQTSS